MTVGTRPLPLFESPSECFDCDAPIAVRLIDLEQRPEELRLPPSGDGTPYRRLLTLVRDNGDPLGWVALPVSPDGSVSLDSLPAPSSNGNHSAPQNRVASDHTPAPDLSPAERAAESLLSIVVATCAERESVLRCVQRIQSAASGPYEVIVVENRPTRSTVAQALDERFGDDVRIRYVEEHRPGLACARNAGLRVARGELVAFTDDDVLIDPAWVPALRRAFAATPRVSCVTGLILPLELETPAQMLIERFAGYGKGFVARTYSLDAPPPDQPLFPYTAGYFGSGANMAFRTSTLRELGGFDPVLGTGTHARGCEDLDICSRILNAGARLTYEPRAIVWHRHPNTAAHLRRRVFDYGAALGALLTKHILCGPHRWRILSRAPQGLRYYVSPQSRKNTTRGPVFPKGLTRLERAGVVYGPLAYLASRLDALR